MRRLHVNLSKRASGSPVWADSHFIEVFSRTRAAPGIVGVIPVAIWFVKLIKATSERGSADRAQLASRRQWYDNEAMVGLAAGIIHSRQMSPDQLQLEGCKLRQGGYQRVSCYFEVGTKDDGKTSSARVGSIWFPCDVKRSVTRWSNSQLNGQGVVHLSHLPVHTFNLWSKLI